jgi:hypothetical protein
VNLETIVGGRKVAIFLNGASALFEAVSSAGAREVALFTRERAGSAPASAGVTRILYSRHGDVRRNNADVLMMDRGATIAMRQFRIFGHAKYMLLPANIYSWPAWFFGFPHLMRGRLAYRGAIRVPSGPRSSSRWLVFENTNRKFASGPRFYVSIAGGMTEMAENLRGLNYCVMRWHRRLDRLEALSDLDILVSNEDLHELIDRLNRKIGFFPVDVFTTFSAQGHSRSGMSYYPPLRAIELLHSCVEGRFGERRPDAKHALLSFAYHLLFHKGIRSLGTNDEFGPETWQSPHYFEELMLLCDEAGVARFSKLSDLVQYLRDHDWIPPQETLNKIAKDDPFVKERFYDPAEYRPGLVVFVLREIAVRRGIVADIERMISGHGFEILRSVPIPDAARFRVTAEFRGGNWYSLGDREQEGGPAHLVIAFDPQPIALADVRMKRRTRSRYEHIDNYRTLRKIDIRERAAALLGNRRLNALHASDNSREALEYIKVVSPDLYESLRSRVLRRPDTA